MMQLLLVEDTLTQSMYMSHALSQAGYEVIVARSGEKALEELDRMADHAPDVVLTDINMPGINGYDLIKIVKEKYGDVKTILLITANQLSEVDEIINSDADGIVFKSTQANRFVAQVKFSLESASESNKSSRYLLLAYQQILDLQNQ